MKVTIASSTITSGIEVFKGLAKVDKAWVKFSDLLRGDGVTSALLATKGGDAELRDFVKTRIIVPAFSVAEQSLLAKETKSLSDGQKGNKRALQQKIGAYFAKIEAHLREAEDKAKAAALTEAEKAEAAEKAKAEATLKARLDKDLASWIVRLEKCEANDFKSLPDVIKALKIAQTVCNAA